MLNSIESKSKETKMGQIKNNIADLNAKISVTITWNVHGLNISTKK